MSTAANGRFVVKAALGFALAKATAEKDWDSCEVRGVGGKWSTKRR
jgi:hypothetical protein